MKAPVWAVVLSLVTPAVLGGCTSSLSHDVARNPSSFGEPDAPAPLQVSQQYRIGPSDELKITVFQVPDLSSTPIVDAAGRINVPLIGSVPVAGQTPSEVKQTLEGLYGAKYLKDPQLDVAVTKAVSQRVTVDGAVAQPGLYPITGNTTLLQAISLAHGAREDALLSRVVIFRRIDGKREAAAFDLRQIRQGKMQDPEIYGDDIIVVDGSSVRRNLRDAIGSIPLLALFNVL